MSGVTLPGTSITTITYTGKEEEMKWVVGWLGIWCYIILWVKAVELLDSHWQRLPKPGQGLCCVLFLAAFYGLPLLAWAIFS